MMKLVKNWWPELLLGIFLAFVGVNLVDSVQTHKALFYVWCLLWALYFFIVGCKAIMIIVLHICDEALTNMKDANKSVDYKKGYGHAIVYIASLVGGVKCNTR